MAVPRNRVSNAKKNSRRAHHALKPKNTSACANCGHTKLPHTLCSQCGMYKGKSVLAAQQSHNE